ncbi:hypothetical protein N4599_02605 [Limosilactobacillus oris]|uniref:hypothetical protein n=1 Tax=Limosilactobacillus oris TaxID=1632 RepID=UPI0021B3DF53|nr:hypothetical protein [Limosilactobacillus oris]UXC67853.1 hypothetical protein N4599_02605 [Limosilactobacillus oris]
MAKKSSYWRDREEQERRWQMKQLADDERYIGQIRSQYEAAIRRINDDINNQLQWLSTRSGQPYAEMQKEVDNLDIQRASQDAQKLVGRANQLRGQGHRVTYGDFTSEENARMRLYNATMRINRLEFLKSEVGLELTQLTGELNASLGLKLTDDARKEFKRQAGIMGEQLGNAKPWTSFQPQVLVMKNVQGGNWSQRLWKNQDVLKANLDAVLSAGFISGESNQKMAQRLRKAVRSTMENQRYANERLVRTESARVAYEVQRESIEANGFKWVEWFAEPSACTVCARLARVDNGEGPGIYPLKKVPKIPQDTHPNCRCSIGSYYSDKMLDKKLNELGFGKNEVKRVNLAKADFELTTDPRIIQNRYDQAVKAYKERVGVDIVDLMKQGKFVDTSNQYNDAKSKFIKYLMVENSYDSLPKPVDKFSDQVVYRGVHDSQGKSADEFIDDLKHRPLMISGGYSSSKGRGYYFAELELQAEIHARPNGKVTKWGIAKGATVLDIDDAKQIIREIDNIRERNNVMDFNYDIIGILSHHDIIKAGGTINVLNGGTIEWLKNTK